MKFLNMKQNPFVLSIANRGNLDEYYTDLSNWGISNYYKNFYRKKIFQNYQIVNFILY